MKKILIVFSAFLLLGCNKIDIKDKEDMTTNIKMIINSSEFDVMLYDNDTTKEFLKLLPLEIDMNELNGNEKYYYLDNNLPTNAFNPIKINKGDIYLYGNNCLVLFYETFNTSYTYTLLGSVQDSDELDKVINSDDITVKFIK